jgi:DNA-binding HxlR family transcriptional regulator
VLKSGVSPVEVAMQGYGQYCPLAKGAEVFAERWTPLILRELLRGSTSFNDIHRGVPRMSRTLLSTRLGKLESCGVIERRATDRGREYHLTQAGQQLGPVVTQLGTWAQRWFRSTFVPRELDIGILMWDMRCTIDARAFPKARVAVQFVFGDLSPNARSWWLVCENGDVDLCPVDPGLDIGLLVRTTLRTMTRVWMGDLSLSSAMRGAQLTVTGASSLKRRFEQWLHLSPYAGIAGAPGALPDAHHHPRRLDRRATV